MLLSTIQKKSPLIKCNVVDGYVATEMIQGVFKTCVSHTHVIIVFIWIASTVLYKLLKHIYHHLKHKGSNIKL